MNSQPKNPWYKNSGQESKKGHAEKDVKSKCLAKASAVGGIKIFDNNDQATKHYCCLITAQSES